MKLKQDPDGQSCSSLGDDGVLRSIHSQTNEVIDAKGLSPDEIKAFLDTMPVAFQKKVNYDGVDGRNVSYEEMYRAPPKVEHSEAWKARIEGVMNKQMEVASRVKDRSNMTPEDFEGQYTGLKGIWEEAKISVMPEDLAEKEEAEKWNEHCDMWVNAQKEGYDRYLAEQEELKAQTE